MTKIQKDNKNVAKFPNLRFPEFEGQWKVKKLGEITTSYSGGTPLTSKREYFDGNIPFIRSGEINSDKTEQFISELGLKKSSAKMVEIGDILYALYGATSGEVGIGKIKGAINQAILCLKSTENHYFLYSYLSHKKETITKTYLQGGQGNLSAEIVKKIELTIPTIKEQSIISDFLYLIDTRIATQTKIIEELKLLKITISKKLFSRQLRFKNGNNENYIDWNTKKLGEVTTLVNKRNKNNEKLPVYSINNKLGFVPQSEQFEGVDSEDRGYDIKLYKIINKNTFAYNPARINVGSIGYSENLENIIISSLYVCFKTDNTVNDNFLYQYLKTDFFNREVLRNVEGGVRDYLFYDNFARIKFDFPCIEEQKKIADYLSSIDSKIDIENQLLHKFEEQKRYLLANLFI